MSEAIHAEGPESPTTDVVRGLWVYGVVPAEVPLPEDLSGVDDEPVELVEAEGVAAVVSWMDVDRPAGRKAELLAHQAVIERLAATLPVAPVRFGTVLEDVAAVEDFLLEQGAELDRVLTLVSGRKQYNLRATYVEDAVLAELVASDPEIRDLRARTRDVPEEVSYAERVRLGELVVSGLEHRGAEDAELLRDQVFPYAVAHVDRAGSSPSSVLDVALLVDEAQQDDLVQLLEGLAEALDGRIHLELLGPLAPYDFAGGF